MAKRRKTARPDRLRKPREFLRDAETRVASIRKQLRQWRQRFPGHSGSTDDAIALTLLIEQLARKGRTATAAQATVLAEKTEIIIDLLGTEIDALLAS